MFFRVAEKIRSLFSRVFYFFFFCFYLVTSNESVTKTRVMINYDERYALPNEKYIFSARTISFANGEKNLKKKNFLRKKLIRKNLSKNGTVTVDLHVLLYYTSPINYMDRA